MNFQAPAARCMLLLCSIAVFQAVGVQAFTAVPSTTTAAAGPVALKAEVKTPGTSQRSLSRELCVDAVVCGDAELPVHLLSRTARASLYQHSL